MIGKHSQLGLRHDRSEMTPQQAFKALRMTRRV